MLQNNTDLLKYSAFFHSSHKEIASSLDFSKKALYK